MKTEMTPEIFAQLSKEEKHEYYKNEIMPNIKWEIDEDGDGDGDYYPSNLEYFDGKFKETHSLNGILLYFHRIKPEPKYVQFTYEDRNLFMGKIVKDKSEKNTYLITRANSIYIWAGNVYWDYYYGLENIVFADGSPFGRKVV